MAVHHPATIVPTKLELLQAWVPHQPWLGDADASTLTKLGSYRFDDPDGEVGMETHLLATADGQVLQVPLTYRGSPRAGAEDSLITTMTHTTLGDRWIYDGCHDPVYVRALVTTILTGGREADLYAATDTGLVLEPATTHVRGSGSLPTADVPVLTSPVVGHAGTTTTIDVGVRLTLPRVVLATTPGAGAGAALSGTWPGQGTPVVLATVDGRA
ncbi:CG0192-related protein [Kineococcus sp. NUM-3379]